MTEQPAQTFGDIALEVRSKNAGPFWVTMELFMRNPADYALAAAPEIINEDAIAFLYGVRAEDVQIFRIPSLNVVKISFPRPVPQGGLLDRDIHAGQHHVPLASLPIPPSTSGR
ncbi:DUF4387 domain-containing protein [Lentzea sp. BCCO 10_0061]|uniref:DUF4387 domain-containing protein n=1 Tax=Lentzea sokolovensis TaxID=3095429 RepID=A0ABU4USU0_9PSEU|nr:DUF4387 domain-containing protein [Lentzea sp. BCCO 10_0061]MDX8142544.1 DUF4387 domain-containing protein [Lentzea sp. BCCO 10_0061]